MEGRHHGDRRVGVDEGRPSAAQACDTGGGLHGVFHRTTAEADDDGGGNDRDLFCEIGAGGRTFFGCRYAVAGRAVLHDVGNINMIAREAHGDNHFVEQFACGADERPTCAVLDFAGAFTDEHDFGIDIAFAPDEIGSRRALLLDGGVLFEGGA